MVTEAFLPLAQAEARALNMALKLVPIKHPVGGLTAEELEDRIQEASRKILEWDETRPDTLTESPDHAEIWDVDWDPGEWNTWVDQQGWGDGLPTLLPTAQVVDRFIAQLESRDWEALPAIPPLWGHATLRALVANAVMAGCQPQDFPVVWAALRAVLDTRFNLYGILATTHPATPLVIVNGPVRDRLGINGGANCLGQGTRANAVIGRGLHMILVNIGGAQPGMMDRATHGSPAKYSYCFAERETASPWDPYHVRRGYSATDSVVTVAAAEGPHNINDHGSTSAEEIIMTIAGTMATTGSNNLYRATQHLLVLGPEHAETIAKGHWTLEALQSALFEQSRVPVTKVSKGNQRFFSENGVEPKGGYYYLGSDPDCVQIVVAGGFGKHSVWIPTFGSSSMISTTIPGY